MFQWDEFRSYSDGMNRLEHSILARCFSDYVEGNDGFEDMSSAEMAHSFSIFKAGWIVSQLLCTPGRER